MSVNVCAIGEDVKTVLHKFRFKKHEVNTALILKVDREKQVICVDEIVEDISIEELQECLPGHQPRFVIYSYRLKHSDGRMSYPMCFIFVTPRDSQVELQMMYAGSKLALQREVNLPRGLEVRELEEMTEEWLNEGLIT